MRLLNNKPLKQASKRPTSDLPFSASWQSLQSLYARRESARKLLLDPNRPDGDNQGTAVADESHIATPTTTTTATNNNLCFIGMADSAGGGSRLRGALLLASLKSIATGGALRRALSCAPPAPGVALHLLPTASARLTELSASGRSNSGVISAVYREAFVKEITKIARLVVGSLCTRKVRVFITFPSPF